MNDEIENNFTVNILTQKGYENCQKIRETAKTLAYLIEELCPQSREKRIAMTKIEEAAMWARESITRSAVFIDSDFHGGGIEKNQDCLKCRDYTDSNKCTECTECTNCTECNRSICCNGDTDE